MVADLGGVDQPEPIAEQLQNRARQWRRHGAHHQGPGHSDGVQLMKHLLQLLGVQVFKHRQGDHHLVVALLELVKLVHHLDAVHHTRGHGGLHAINATAERPQLPCCPGLGATAKVEHGAALNHGSDPLCALTGQKAFERCFLGCVNYRRQWRINHK